LGRKHEIGDGLIWFSNSLTTLQALTPGTGSKIPGSLFLGLLMRGLIAHAVIALPEME
jgi:hypothetical protein